MKLFRSAIVLLFLFIASCATHPTADIYIEGLSVKKSAELRGLVENYLEREGFRNVFGIWQEHGFAGAMIAVSFSEDDGVISGIRVISHGAPKSQVLLLGEEIQMIIDEFAPDLDLRYRYFDQTHPFG